MKTKPAGFLLWVLVALMCVCVISVPISAAGGGSETPDAVAGARGGIYQLLSAGSANAYDIFTPAREGGSIFSSASSGVPGKTVEVFIQPNAEYEMASIFVIAAGGDQLEVFLKDGVYSFIMPDEPVVIDVTFQLKRIA
ncbi:MAG TPA: hypothetical protein DC001_01660 [Clostridiales bacterium]|jgi:hypothetical protein|nr:hypothetical protein [Clostridiales bacterium]HBR08392.1 hypothetical protein [Clostridiales bacterium]